jgi:hypothetical protein
VLLFSDFRHPEVQTVVINMLIAFFMCYLFQELRHLRMERDSIEDKIHHLEWSLK